MNPQGQPDEVVVGVVENPDAGKRGLVSSVYAELDAVLDNVIEDKEDAGGFEPAPGNVVPELMDQQRSKIFEDLKAKYGHLLNMDHMNDTGPQGDDDLKQKAPKVG